MKNKNTDNYKTLRQNNSYLVDTGKYLSIYML